MTQKGNQIPYCDEGQIQNNFLHGFYTISAHHDSETKSDGTGPTFGFGKRVAASYSRTQMRFIGFQCMVLDSNAELRLVVRL